VRAGVADDNEEEMRDESDESTHAREARVHPHLIPHLIPHRTAANAMNETVDAFASIKVSSKR